VRGLSRAVVALLALSSIARAQGTDRSPAPADPHAAQPERPTVATHAGTVAPGWVELEAGMERDDLHGAHTFFTPTVLKLGIAPRVQLELASSFVHLSGSTPEYSGIGDASAAVKWRALEHAPVMGDFALEPSLKLPSGSALHGTGTGTTDVGLLLISSHDLGAYALDVNVGYTRRSGNGSRAPRDATLWTVSGGGPVYESLGWVAEVFGFPGTTGPSGNRGTVAFLTGPAFTVAKWFVVDAGAIVPLTGPQPHSWYAGLTWNVGKL
jgi:outer membrane putative beta-barrel porin/alpha-amylase